MPVAAARCRAAVLVLRSLPGAEAGWLPPLRRRRREEQSQRDGLPLRERPSRGFGQFQRGDTILVADHGHGAIEDVGKVVHLARSEEHTSELQSLMSSLYAVFR